MTLRNFVTESGIVQEDKNFWFEILAKLDQDQIKIFEDFIDGKEENLTELTENIKAKQKAIENLDDMAMEKIIASEQ